MLLCYSAGRKLEETHMQTTEHEWFTNIKLKKKYPKNFLMKKVKKTI